MTNTLDNEFVLIGKIMPGIQHLSINKQNACRLKIKIDDKYLSNTIPLIFINPNEEQLSNLKNREIAIIGHIEAKWNLKIIVDAYKVNDEVMVKVQ